MAVKEDAQVGMFDRTIENPDLEELLELRLEHREAANAYAGASRGIKKMLDAISPPLEDGQRVRCGGYVWTAKGRTGGGFSIDEWESVGISDLAAI